MGILQALSLTGSITYGMAFPIVMGQNIGTCVTALISSIGTTTKAKRVAFLHITLNTVCSIFCLIVMMLAQTFLPSVSNLLGQAVKPWDIAMLHTLFNIVATVVLMPFSKQLVWLVETMVKEKQTTAQAADIPMLDERLLRSPSVAVSESFNLSREMCREAHEIIQESIVLFERYDVSMEENILWLEDRLDHYEDQLGTYLVKLSSQALSNQDSQVVSKILHAIGDFERLGDHACNLADVAKDDLRCLLFQLDVTALGDIHKTMLQFIFHVAMIAGKQRSELFFEVILAVGSADEIQHSQAIFAIGKAQTTTELLEKDRQRFRRA